MLPSQVSPLDINVTLPVSNLQERRVGSLGASKRSSPSLRVPPSAPFSCACEVCVSSSVFVPAPDVRNFELAYLRSALLSRLLASD